MAETKYKLGKTTWRIDLDASGDHCWVSDQVFDSFVTEEELLEMGATPIDKPKEAVGTMRTVKGYLSGNKVREIVEKYKNGGAIGLVDLAVEVEVPGSWDKPQPIQPDDCSCHGWGCKDCDQTGDQPDEAECGCVKSCWTDVRGKTGTYCHCKHGETILPHPSEEKIEMFDYSSSEPNPWTFDNRDLIEWAIKINNTLNSLTGKEGEDL